MGYKWDDWRDTCHRLYVVEKKSIDEVVEYCKEQDFTPSKRAFEAHFKTWGFKKLASPLSKNALLVQRIGELWQNNLTGADMVTVLAGEGHDVTERQISRVRKKEGWFVRERPSVSSTLQQGEKGMGPEEESSMADGDKDNEMQFVFGEDGLVRRLAERPSSAKRTTHQAELPVDTSTSSHSNKRRRRVQTQPANPADPNDIAPRFPSELTIDSSKFLLHLSNETYRQIRDSFESICHSMSIVKKTQAGPEKWQAAKTALVASNPFLAGAVGVEPHSSAHEVLKLEYARKMNALDVICTQVTKRMRIVSTQLTVRDAKTLLGLNPAQAHEVRALFQQVLRADHDATELRLVVGNSHWAELRTKWIASSPLLHHLLVGDNSDDDGTSEHTDQLRAANCFARDVWKRLRHAQKQKDPSYARHTQKASLGPGPMAPVGREGRAKSRFAAPPPGQRLVVSEPDEDEDEDEDEDSVDQDEDDGLQIDPNLLGVGKDRSFGGSGSRSGSGSLAEQLQHFARQK